MSKSINVYNPELDFYPTTCCVYWALREDYWWRIARGIVQLGIMGLWPGDPNISHLKAAIAELENRTCLALFCNFNNWTVGVHLSSFWLIWKFLFGQLSGLVSEQNGFLFLNQRGTRLSYQICLPFSLWWGKYEFDVVSCSAHYVLWAVVWSSSWDSASPW